MSFLQGRTRFSPDDRILTRIRIRVFLDGRIWIRFFSRRSNRDPDALLAESQPCYQALDRQRKMDEREKV